MMRRKKHVLRWAILFVFLLALLTFAGFFLFHDRFVLRGTLPSTLDEFHAACEGVAGTYSENVVEDPIAVRYAQCVYGSSVYYKEFGFAKPIEGCEIVDESMSFRTYTSDSRYLRCYYNALLLQHSLKYPSFEAASSALLANDFTHAMTHVDISRSPPAGLAARGSGPFVVGRGVIGRGSCVVGYLNLVTSEYLVQHVAC